VAVAFGRTAAIVASILTFLTFDWFFDRLFRPDTIVIDVPYHPRES
jgi:hypothetical protein